MSCLDKPKFHNNGMIIKVQLKNTVHLFIYCLWGFSFKELFCQEKKKKGTWTFWKDFQLNHYKRQICKVRQRHFQRICTSSLGHNVPNKKKYIYFFIFTLGQKKIQFCPVLISMTGSHTRNFQSECAKRFSWESKLLSTKNMTFLCKSAWLSDSIYLEWSLPAIRMLRIADIGGGALQTCNLATLKSFLFFLALVKASVL